MNAEVDVDALEKAAQEAISGEEEIEEVIEEPGEDEFDIDGALEGTDPIELEGRISEDEAKEKASERGWREDGVDRYGNRISAIEFLERTPFFTKIDKMHHDIEAQNEKIRQLAENSKLIAKKAVEDKQKLVAELKETKSKLLDNEVLDQDNILELKKIDKQIEDHSVIETDHGESSDEESAELAIEYEKKLDNFKDKNEWYGKDRALAALADKLALDYVTEFNRENGHVPPPDDMFNHVVGEMKKDYPDLGKKKTRVASTGRRTVVNKPVTKKTIDDLPEDQRAVARQVIDSIPDMDEEKYLKTYNFD